jgi:predicted small secreted protein
MDKHKNDNKFLPLAITGAVLSFILGIVTFFIIDNHTTVNADKILNNVKEQFREDGPIEGSWIEMTKVPWKKYSYDTDVFYGGISRKENGKIAQYEFVADAYTGALMDIYEV